MIKLIEYIKTDWQIKLLALILAVLLWLYVAKMRHVTRDGRLGMAADTGVISQQRAPFAQ